MTRATMNGTRERKRTRRGRSIGQIGVALGVAFAAFVALATLSVADEQNLGGKTQNITCTQSECSYDKNVGAHHSKDFNVSCSSGAVDSKSYCKSKAPKHLNCDGNLQSANEFHCHCKNTSVMQGSWLIIDIYCDSG